MNPLSSGPYLHTYPSSMRSVGRRRIWLPFLFVLLLASGQVWCQTDTAKAGADTFFLMKKKGLLGRLAKSITKDTAPSGDHLQRIDLLYKQYRGRVIRNIFVQRLEFGVPLDDTSRTFKNTLTRMAEGVHHTTREYVIRNNLFFRKNDVLEPYLIADNERHLRDQVYLGDARIEVTPVIGTHDSVDITVYTKDVLSIGGSFRMSSTKKFQVALREDNFMGWGDRFQLSALYDQDRKKRLGHGVEYITRNIAGSFVDGYIGYQDFANTFNTANKQEKMIYARFVKPLVNPYMKWTYAAEGAFHNNTNMYFPDSLYKSDLKYQYYNVDAWVALNFRSNKSSLQPDDERLRTMVALRVLHQEFQDVPVKYMQEYNYQYADLTGILASMSIFRQDFYKTQYIYGFGRNEDVPEGIDLSVTTGWTNKQQRVRPYMGLDMQVNYFTRKKNYFNYTFRAGAYSYQRRYEDISLLFSLDYFTRLRQLSSRWRQRTFISAGITTQLNKQLNEPLLLESQYGLQEYENIYLGGDHRFTIKAETVFFNDWSLFAFRFAPFVFSHASFISPEKESFFKTNFYNTIGTGLRSRNESLIFGTFELRAYYFTRKNFNNDRFRVEFNTNIKFKYNSQFIRRPQFIVVN